MAKVSAASIEQMAVNNIQPGIKLKPQNEENKMENMNFGNLRDWGQVLETLENLTQKDSLENTRAS